MSKWLQPGPRKWRGVALVLPFVLLMLAGFLYTNHVQQESDRKWCELIVFLDDRRQTRTAEDETNRQFTEALHRLRQRLNC